VRLAVPAKTFLLGEYAALSAAPALLLASEPSFVVERTKEPDLIGIHPDSPAGKFWRDHSDRRYGLQFFDPYGGIGGLGASSAQFLGAYQLVFGKDDIAIEHLLSQYYHYAWNGIGARPSGYDILAQMHQGLVFVDRQQERISTMTWPFDNLAVYLIHTGKKLATHTYLQDTRACPDYSSLGRLAAHAFDAVRTSSRSDFLQAVRAAGECLDTNNLVALHSKALIAKLYKQNWVQAVKGCGAMGADILSVYIAPEYASALRDFCILQGLHIVSQ